MRRLRDPQLIVYQFREISLGVRIAGDRDRGLGALASLAQRRLRPQFTRLDHDAAILQRRLRQRVDPTGKTP